jgi:ferrochelatase
LKNKKALVLLNMGAARSKDELATFLRNMFNDKNILSIPNDLIRSMVASLIVMLRLDKAWENYEQIGGASPLHQLTNQLISKLQPLVEDKYYVVEAMRYTSPFAQTAIAKIDQQNIKDIVLLPLYPQYSTTTTKSSVEDFVEHCKEFDFNIEIIDSFYKNDLLNQSIYEEILKTKNNDDDFHLIFSAHGLPQKVINKGDPYQKQIEEHIKLLTNKLHKNSINFKSTNLAYQSKVGPMKWLEPSLEDMLKNFSNQKVIIYPISFLIDNSETVFELQIEYKEIAHNLGIKEYRVCSCPNFSDTFIQTLIDLI